MYFKCHFISFERKIAIFISIFFFSPDNGSGYPTFDCAGQGVEIQDSVAVLFYGAQRESQNAVHQIERVPLDVECSVGRIRIKQVIGDSPRVAVAMVVDEQPESSHIGDIDEGVVAPLVADVDREGDEQGIVLELFLGELVLAQKLVRSQVE